MTIVRIVGFDEYARFQSEIFEVDQNEVTSKLKYAYLGDRFLSEWIPKIGEWFWK